MHLVVTRVIQLGAETRRGPRVLDLAVAGFWVLCNWWSLIKTCSFFSIFITTEIGYYCDVNPLILNSQMCPFFHKSKGNGDVVGLCLYWNLPSRFTFTSCWSLGTTPFPVSLLTFIAFSKKIDDLEVCIFFYLFFNMRRKVYNLAQLPH